MESSPLLKKKKRKVAVEKGPPCIICNEPVTENSKNPNIDQWKSFKELAKAWAPLNSKFSHVFSSVTWENGPSDYEWHKDCKWKMSNKRTLQQATNSFNQSNTSTNTSNTSILATSSDSQTDIIIPPVTRQATGVIHQKELCLWCRKGQDDKHPDRKSNLHLLEQMDTWFKIKASVIHLKDPEMKNRLTTLVDATCDPLAQKIRYHLKCYLNYVTNMLPTDKPSISSAEHLQGMTQSDVQKMFIHQTYQSIIENGEARTLASLTAEYERIRLNFGMTAVIRTSQIKELLSKEFGNKIGFQERYHKNKSTIVFNSSETGNYIESAINFWGIKTEDILKVAANRIASTLKEEKKFPNPPRVSDLTNLHERITSESTVLEKFLGQMLPSKKRAKRKSKILFLSDAIKSLVTGKKTQLPTALSMIVHGLTRSKQISTFLYHAGVGNSIDDITNLYKFWAYDSFIQNPSCPDELCEGKPGTAIIDNDDFNDDDLTGGTTTHRTNMMFIQPEKYIPQKEGPNNPLKRCSNGEIKSVAAKEHEVSSTFEKKIRGDPKNFKTMDTSAGTTHYIRKKLIAHAIVRCKDDGTDKQPEEQTIGAFSGFMSSISESEDRSKPYYHVTVPKKPSKKIVNSLMEKAVAAAEAKNMPFIQFVGDQPVYAFIEELVSENPVKFEKILPVLGPFHTQACFMSAILKRLKGSGIEEILVAAGLIAEGSVEQALKGKHYNRAQRLYKLLYEALVRHLMRSEGNRILPKSIRDMIDIIGNTNIDSADRRFSLETLLEDAEFDEYVSSLFKHIDGPESHLAKYIVSIMQMIEIYIMNNDSIRTHDWIRYLESIRLMIPWITIYDNINFRRWLPVFWLRMKSLPAEWAECMPEIFAQSMTTNPYSALPTDMWIECTMNKGSKLKSGWKRALKNEKALFCHNRNANNINAIRNTMTNFFAALRFSHKHKENVKSRLRIDETAIQSIISLFSEWECDPFDLTSQQLRSLQSGMLASEKLVKDFESAHADGEKHTELMITQRLYSTKSLHDKFNRHDRLNFDKMTNASNTTGKQGSAEMEGKAIISVIELVRKENPEMFKEIWNHRISDHCLSVFNHNGSIRKCQKSKLIEMLNFTEVCPQSYIAICDMGFFWHISTPTADDREKENETPYTWRDYANKMFDLILSRHRNAKMFVLVNDYYGRDVINIKDGEHANRAQRFLGGESPNMYPMADKLFPTINQFKTFFQNNANKTRLQEFLKVEFKYRCQENGISILYTTRNRCDNLSAVLPTRQYHNYSCNHIEADTAMFYVYSEIRKSGDESPVVIDSEDADVVVLSAYVSHRIDGCLAIKRKKGIFDCKQLCNREMSEVIVRFYVGTGCDSISSFFGIGKKSVWKNIFQNEEAIALLKSFSDDAMKSFVIRFVYNDKRSLTLSGMREKRWNRMKTKSLATAGIDEDTCLLRNKRVRYQTYLFEHYHESQLSVNPLLNGGFSREGDVCVPIKYSKPSLPDHISVLAEQNVSGENDYITQDYEEDYEEENEDEGALDSDTEI